jgi:hypothetical protein
MSHNLSDGDRDDDGVEWVPDEEHPGSLRRRINPDDDNPDRREPVEDPVGEPEEEP